MAVDPYLMERLVCPRHRTPLSERESALWCAEGHSYPVVEDVPILLENGPQTLWVAEYSLKQGLERNQDPAPYYLNTVAVSRGHVAELEQQLAGPPQPVDPVVSFLLRSSSGISYRHLVGKLKEYPIPNLRLPPGNGRELLDIGCNWGRWSFAAARKGYRTIGIDPSLGAVLAARRVARQLKLDSRFFVGDARFLPLRDGSVDNVYSYSVIQHFSPADASTALQEIGRVLRPGGRSAIQMPTILGLRCLYHQARRRFREPRGFEVRYWSTPRLRRLFTESIGPSRLSVDCFFGIGLQASDVGFMPPLYRLVIRISELLRKTSRILPPLRHLADSVYVESTR